MMLMMLLLQSGLLLAQPASDEQLAAISRLGELNGIALQCRYIEQMQNIKRSMILNLPKKRELGFWFEQTTNTAFMDFLNKNAACPDSEVFTQQVNTARTRLETVFKK